MSKNKFNIVVASDVNLKDFIDPCLSSIKNCGYDPVFYNLGGLDFGIPFYSETSDASLQKFPKKPAVIKDALSKLKNGDWLAWIDVDCIMQFSIDDAIGEYDIGLTFRKNHINSGVNFWQNNETTHKFLDVWSSKSIIVNGDQNALNEICNITSYNTINSTINILDASIKVFDSRIYNNFFFKKDQSTARILHYKSKHRHRFPFNKTLD